PFLSCSGSFAGLSVDHSVMQSVRRGPPPGARSRWQSGAQPSPTTVLPSSQVSPQTGMGTPSPQPSPTSRRQSVQPSHAVALPSSHSSLLSVTPSPQRGKTQLVRQASAVVSLLPAPSSQRSQNASNVPSPQTAVPGVQRLTMSAECCPCQRNMFTNRLPEA